MKRFGLRTYPLLAALVIACLALMLPPQSSRAADAGGDLPDRQQTEESARTWIRLQMERGEYESAAEAARNYIDDRVNQNTRRLPEVCLWLAESYDKRGLRDDAIATYVKVWAAYMGSVGISAPAIKRYMELGWERNLPERTDDSGRRCVSDRQSAYNAGARFIEATDRPEFRDQMTAGELEKWDAVRRLVATYAADPGIKTLEAQRMASAEQGGKKLDIGLGWIVAVGLTFAAFVAMVVWSWRRNCLSPRIRESGEQGAKEYTVGDPDD
ncbi:MAG: hypothetical protein J0M04_12035 [Verrucomicrobia bacterium]|nr:hypothetical protein [Verrucomicrobiota bacterium]